jgi:monofunctional biosynthetic peptidoglycan transglycosylase
VKRAKFWFGRIVRFAVGAAAVLFACAAYTAISSPDVRLLRSGKPESTAFMDLRAREARSEGKAVRREQRWLPYRQISPTLVRAVIVTEDAAFWSHDGIDYGELQKSFSWDRLYFVRGASTITQQLAKNLYLSPSRNPYRKFEELLITRRLEAELPKARILELYLNVIEWGDGVWGADAAARSYFGRSASDVSSEQAALMAGAIINPRIYSPSRPNRRLQNRQQIILRRLNGGTRTTEVPARVEEDAAPAPE